MSPIDTLPPLRAVIAGHGLSARKALGQNFLLDLNLTMRIARAAGPLEGHTVLEVGPGPGGLTRALLAAGADTVVAVEQDARFLPVLDEIGAHYPGRLRVIHADARTLDPAVLGAGPVRVVANLPYNVGTILLVDWLSAAPWPPWWASLTLMFQREVAERIVAPPGSGAYGRLSVLAQWRARARIVFDVPPEAFVPPPKVTSSVVHIVPGEAPEGVDPGVLSRVTAAAFGQRRKMLRQTLRPVLGPAASDASARLEALGIDPTRRAETLSIDEFLTIARAVGPGPIPRAGPC